MDRLTARSFGAAAMAWEHEERHTPEEWIDILQNKLAAYEDTGYTPEDFDRLCREMSNIRTFIGVATYEELRDLVAGRRLVLLPPKEDQRRDTLALMAALHVIEERYPSEVIFRPRDRDNVGLPEFIGYDEAEKRLRRMVEEIGGRY